jgi:WLM domain
MIVAILILLLIYALYTKKCECDKKNTILNMVISKIMIFLNHLSEKYFIKNPREMSYAQKRIAQLLTKFDANNIHELNMRNYNNETAYTINKSIIYICLQNKVYPNKIYNINTVMFVVLHELAHMANDSWDHGNEFWALFKLLLVEAHEARIYIPVDYQLLPEKYCNTDIDYNPYFDKDINIALV